MFRKEFFVLKIDVYGIYEFRPVEECADGDPTPTTRFWSETLFFSPTLFIRFRTSTHHARPLLPVKEIA